VDGRRLGMRTRAAVIAGACLALGLGACSKERQTTALTTDAAAPDAAKSTPAADAGDAEASGDASPTDGSADAEEASTDATTALDSSSPVDATDDGGADSTTTRDGALTDVVTEAVTDAVTEADASPTTCADGSPILYTRTACTGPALAATATLVSDSTSATRGDVVSLGGLDEPTAPCAPVLVCTPVGAPTMLFSDDPESPSSDGVLYADVIGPGAFRAYVYHTNGGSGLRKFPVVLLNQGTVDVNVTIGAAGVAGPDTDYVAVGKEAIVAWLGPVTPQAVVVPAGQRVLLDADLDAVHAANGELAHAILDFTLDGPVKLSVVSVVATEDATVVTAGLNLLPSDGLHQRGTFPGAARTLQGTAPLDASSVRRLTLGDGVVDVDLAGHDAVDGTSVSLGGNYGLAYELDLELAVETALAIAPKGGAWGGGANVPAGEDGLAGIVSLPSASSSLGSQSEAILLGRFAAQSSVSVTLLSAGGSDLPIDVASVPLP
jgi:hypothetical protein